MLGGMKAVWCSLVLIVLQTLCPARETAYQAMRSLAAHRGQKILSQVIELRGTDGAPQPSTWKIVLDDPVARGGVREFQVRQGNILSERTPVNEHAGVNPACVDVTKLNLDSSGAFTVAEAEARNQKVGFDSVDYLLRCSENGPVPEWVLRLTAQNKGLVGTLHIAADSGQVKLFEKPEPAFPAEQSKSQFEERTEAVRRTLNKTGNNIRDGASRGMDAIRDFFNGGRSQNR